MLKRTSRCPLLPHNGASRRFLRTLQAKEYVLAELTKTSKGKRLKGFEAIRGLILRTEPFAVDDDTMCAAGRLLFVPIAQQTGSYNAS